MNKARPKYTVAPRREGVVISLPSMLLGEHEDLILDAMNQAVRGGPRIIALDFSEVILTNTAGIGVLVLLLDQARRSGATLVISGARGRQRLLLERVGFASHVRMVDDVDRAFHLPPET